MLHPNFDKNFMCLRNKPEPVQMANVILDKSGNILELNYKNNLDTVSQQVLHSRMNKVFFQRASRNLDQTNTNVCEGDSGASVIRYTPVRHTTKV